MRLTPTQIGIIRSTVADVFGLAAAVPQPIVLPAADVPA